MSADLTNEDDAVIPRSSREDVRVLGTFSQGQNIPMKFNREQKSFEFIDYVPPGIHHYKVIWFKEQSPNLPQVLLESDLSVKPREIELKVKKGDKMKEGDDGNEEVVKEKKSFVKERSVFAEFRLDDESVFLKAFELDIARFKYVELLKKKNEVIILVRFCNKGKFLAR